MAAENLNKILTTSPLAIFAVIFVIFIILSVILNYHWTRYGVLPEGVRKVRWIYFGVSAAFFAAMVISYLMIL